MTKKLFRLLLTSYKHMHAEFILYGSGMGDVLRNQIFFYILSVQGFWGSKTEEIIKTCIA